VNADQKVAITQWRDSKVVKFVSNYSTTEPSKHSYVRRGHTSPTPMPTVSKDYREGMGFVDSYDRNKKLYTVKRTVRRWWLTLFFFILDAVVVNSWRIFLFNNEGLRTNERKVWVVFETDIHSPH
jgi:Transposase IS4